MNPATDWVRGTRPGGWGAIDLDGSDDIVKMGDKPKLAVQPKFTASTWFRTTDKGTVISKNESSGGFNGWAIRVVDDTNIRFDVTTDGTHISIQEAVASLGSRWVFATFVIDGLVGTAYLDAVEIGTSTGTGTVDTTTASFNLGSLDAGSLFFQGQIDDVRVWHRSLNASEVAQLYQLEQRGQGSLLNRIPWFGYIEPVGPTPPIVSGDNPKFGQPIDQTLANRPAFGQSEERVA